MKATGVLFTVLFTPREKVGEKWLRRRMRISVDDQKKVMDQASATITDMNTNKRYIARHTSCGLLCKCDAIVREIV